MPASSNLNLNLQSSPDPKCPLLPSPPASKDYKHSRPTIHCRRSEPLSQYFVLHCSWRAIPGPPVRSLKRLAPLPLGRMSVINNGTGLVWVRDEKTGPCYGKVSRAWKWLKGWWIVCKIFRWCSRPWWRSWTHNHKYLHKKDCQGED